MVMLLALTRLAVALGGLVTITALWLSPDAHDQLPGDINDLKDKNAPAASLLMFCRSRRI